MGCTESKEKTREGDDGGVQDFADMLREWEEKYGVDLDGDGVVGRRKPTAPMPQPKPEKVEALQQQNGREPNHRALFIGINYIDSSAELRGCINDVRTMQGLIKSLGFPLNEGEVRSLTEDDTVEFNVGQPTRQNIEEGLRWLVDGALPGDRLFVHYSGHGTSVTDRSGDEDDGKDEALVPVDYQRAGLIVDDDIYDMLVGSLASGVRLTAVMDCCHSGTLLDLPHMCVADKETVTRSLSPRPQRKKYAKRGAMYESANQQDSGDTEGPDVIMFSGCMDSQTSADVSNTTSFDVPVDPNSPGSAGGACTNALAETLCKYPSLTFVMLLRSMQENLKKRRFTQVPQMSSSKPVDLEAVFSLFGDFDG